ncbi:threonine-phosphate decarboxylase CobD [Rhizobium sp. S152]|uniref:threonine-phosphate decarboxylase CobD n=1 Tax=Rhizobium sp. S152 TaxID=3055038 RepID=UPI0025A95F9D|nr:threonine-phosphate decarboxylase CobD [Rhizobium sp. S152]MDM9628396.1 threonine-phosphate decarboxylase CobD [Rhizobium sp. S152]
MNAPIVHGGGITAAAALHGGRPEDWLDLSTGINPNPVSLPDIPMRAWHRLPDRHLIDEARMAARDFYRSGHIMPLPVPGTQSVIQLLPRLIEQGARVAIVGPTYGEYERAFRSAGCSVDLVDGIEQVTPRHRLVVVVNPNNPTGRVYAPDVLAALAERLAARGGMLVVDEAFGDTAREMSLAPYARELPDLVIFRSFGKFFGLAGLRLGFVIASTSVLERFEELLGPWAVSGPALTIASRLLRSEIGGISSNLTKRAAALRAILSAAGITIAGGTDLFTLVEHDDAAALHAHLCRNRILVRKFDYAPHWLRFGIAADAAGDERLAVALRDYSR